MAMAYFQIGTIILACGVIKKTLLTLLFYLPTHNQGQRWRPVYVELIHVIKNRR